jgi:galactose mutarotase-like enzyme
MNFDTSSDIHIQTPEGDSVSVSPIGGLLTLTLHGIPLLIPVIRGDGKSIRTHICSPNFGKDHSGIFSLKQHGNMRNEPCEVHLHNSRIILTHTITDSPHIYPIGVTVMASIELSDGTCLFTITHKNAGTKPATVNCGVHCYFNAPSGYRGTTINTRDVTTKIEQTGHIALKQTNTLTIPGIPSFELQQRGFSHAVLWVGENAKGEKDSTYVCIEPVEFLPEDFNKKKTILYPGTSRTISFSLKIS